MKIIRTHQDSKPCKEKDTFDCNQGSKAYPFPATVAALSQSGIKVRNNNVVLTGKPPPHVPTLENQ